VPEIAAGKLANPIETQSMLADISSWASILSLVLTFVNTYLIIRIRAGIVVNLTLEPILDRLRKNSSEMNQSLSYYDIHSTKFFEAVGICEANVRTVRRRLGYFRGRFCADLLWSIRQYKSNRTQENAQEVYSRRQYVCQQIANMAEERRITG
jgi:hypothetical protein